MANTASQMDGPRYLNHRQAAARCHMSPATLYQRIKDGDGPRRIRVGGKVFYIPEVLDAWMADHEEIDELEPKEPDPRSEPELDHRATRRRMSDVVNEREARRQHGEPRRPPPSPPKLRARQRGLRPGPTPDGSAE